MKYIKKFAMCVALGLSLLFGAGAADAWWGYHHGYYHHGYYGQRYYFYGYSGRCYWVPGHWYRGVWISGHRNCRW